MNTPEVKPTVKPALKPLTFWQSITLGCDPEFFFANQDGSTVGSEKVLPKGGLKVVNQYNVEKSSNIVIDGVQAELNPLPSSCRESLAYQIYMCFSEIKKTLGNKVLVKIDSVVDITQGELDSLSEGSRVFGCAPSLNVDNQGKDKTSKITVDPKKYLKRSAGGHLHLGNHYNGYLGYTIEGRPWNDPACVARRQEKVLKGMPEVLVPMLDLVVGNMCVLLDRDPANVERRKNYGRCGEYRIKEYGIEYRTLSNFWLRSYQLMSLVFGMARFTCHLVEQSTKENDYVKAFMDAVPREKVIKAIQENDFDLAYENFKAIEPLIVMAAGEGGCTNTYYPLKGSVMKDFHHFVKRIQQGGLKYWFPQDAFEHWAAVNSEGRYTYNSKGGWETWSRTYIPPDMAKDDVIDLNQKNGGKIETDPVKKVKEIRTREVAVER